jgi:RNA polymerase sigma-70 factor (sigma-E family)
MDRAATFRSLVARRLDRAYALAAHVLGNRTEAEDACQEALLRAWQSWPQLRDAERFDAWFDRILLNECTTRQRSRARSRARNLRLITPGSLPDPAGGVADADEIGGALQRLPAEQRVVVVLRYWADLQTDTIAERLGIPHGTVRSRLHNALRRLRAQIPPAGEGFDHV